MLLLERFPQETGRSYAVRTLRENIVKLELPPGSQLSEQDIANELGLSRTPVREAIAELAQIGIVEIFPQKRGKVALIDPNLVDEALFMRRVLECAIVGELCRVAVPEDLVKLETNVKLQEFYMSNGSYTELVELYDQFHKMLFFAAKKPKIWDMIDTYSVHFDRVRYMVVKTVQGGLNVVGENQELLRAIQEKDSAKAQRLMEKHLNQKDQYFDRILEAFPETYFLRK